MPFAAFPASGAWPFLGASVVVHLAYYVLLMRSFRPGDLGQAYPIARGTAPLAVTLLAAPFAHEVPDGWAAANIALSCAGLTGVALWGLRGRRPDRAAVGAALATGPTIAGHTVVDGLGVRASGSSLGHITRLMTLEGIALPAYAPHRWRGELIAVLRPYAAHGLLGTALSVLAYGLVLWARTRAEPAPIAALRESSVKPGSASDNAAGPGGGSGALHISRIPPLVLALPSLRTRSWRLSHAGRRSGALPRPAPARPQ